MLNLSIIARFCLFFALIWCNTCNTFSSFFPYLTELNPGTEAYLEPQASIYDGAFLLLAINYFYEKRSIIHTWQDSKCTLEAYFEIVINKIQDLISHTEAAVQKCSWEKVFWKYAANLQENTHAKLRFYWNHTSAWVFSCKFAACFQNIFS